METQHKRPTRECACEKNSRASRGPPILSGPHLLMVSKRAPCRPELWSSRPPGPQFPVPTKRCPIRLPVRLAGYSKKAHQKLLDDHFLCLQMGKQTLTSPQPHHTRFQAGEGPRKILLKRHTIRHLTDSINFPSQAAFHQPSNKLGCLSQNRAQGRQSRRSQTDRIA